MKRNKILCLVALLLALTLLCGCTLPAEVEELLLTLDGYINQQNNVKFSQLSYERPDSKAFVELKDNAVSVVERTEKVDDIISQFWILYDAYDLYYTMLSLADIHYCQNVADSYWKAEYAACMEGSVEVDAAMEDFYYAAAHSDLVDELEDEQYFGPGFFDGYRGESVWDQPFLKLNNRETELLNRYYELAEGSGDLDRSYDALAEVYVELVKVRKQIAARLGFDSYAEYAYLSQFSRDYTPEDMEHYYGQIARVLSPIYAAVDDSGFWSRGLSYCDEDEALEYLSGTASNMGGRIRSAFDFMKKYELFDISYGRNKFDSSFELYLYSYEMPFLFTCPYGEADDALIFAHEFGHFCNDYATSGYSAGTDVAEVFSQGMEYLTLCYTEGVWDEDRIEELTRWKMVDCLCTYVEQACYACFEQRVYALPDDRLTPENVRALYVQTAREFRTDYPGWDSRYYVTVPHFYAYPFYIPSYVVSNDVAFQIYQMELDDPGSGLKAYTDVLESDESYLLYFAEEVGLESPVAEDRVYSVAQTMEQILGDLMG